MTKQAIRTPKDDKRIREGIEIISEKSEFRVDTMSNGDIYIFRDSTVFSKEDEEKLLALGWLYGRAYRLMATWPCDTCPSDCRLSKACKQYWFYRIEPNTPLPSHLADTSGIDEIVQLAIEGRGLSDEELENLRVSNITND